MEKNVRKYSEVELSSIAKMLEDSFDHLNNKYFEGKLSKSIITLQKTNRAYGHFTPNKVWVSVDGGEDFQRHEINLGVATLNRPIEETIATLLHEMVHQYNHENDIKDTSNRGRYHNKKFKHEAEKRDLIIEYLDRYGWTDTTPTPSLIKYVKNNPVFQKIPIYRDENAGRKNIEGNKQDNEDEDKTEKKIRYKYSCTTCGQEFSSTKELNLICGIDNIPMNVEVK
ncbi:MAG: SprT-like domain-containing protein [Streptococcaceae bacterium]|jgi:hypothetical protein|nr:SprT-like domain-containing protein [Streptococcaceae bacterium]